MRTYKVVMRHIVSEAASKSKSEEFLDDNFPKDTYIVTGINAMNPQVFWEDRRNILLKDAVIMSAMSLMNSDRAREAKAPFIVLPTRETLNRNISIYLNYKPRLSDEEILKRVGLRKLVKWATQPDPTDNYQAWVRLYDSNIDRVLAELGIAVSLQQDNMKEIVDIDDGAYGLLVDAFRLKTSNKERSEVLKNFVALRMYSPAEDGLEYLKYNTIKKYEIDVSEIMRNER
jgi:hypothetical protein